MRFLPFCVSVMLHACVSKFAQARVPCPCYLTSLEIGVYVIANFLQTVNPTPHQHLYRDALKDLLQHPCNRISNYIEGDSGSLISGLEADIGLESSHS